jgi:nanoRNase/pAp phosphatase (c-di-AMP/oligoRNAs hydrolase)
MRCLLVSPSDFLFRLFRGSNLPGDLPLYLVENSRVRARISRRGAKAISGNLEDPALYRRAIRSRGSIDRARARSIDRARARNSSSGWVHPILLSAPTDRLAGIVRVIRAAAPHAPLLVLRDENTPIDLGAGGALMLPAGAFSERVIQPELERAALRAKVERIRSHFEPAERVLIMMQDDPDPDAIASALALRALLGRSKAKAPIATFGTITRPENIAMCKILEIEVEEIQKHTMDTYDGVAMVDVQPSFFEERFDAVDLVIDHHPEDRAVKSRFKDIRPSYGATSTILTEYLRATEIKISPKLATALLYGIKSDTLHLERGGTKADMDAFAFLYLLANHNALRRIERPELPPEALDTLAHGLTHRQILRGVLFSHLGHLSRVDLIPQFADLCLQVKGVEWSVVSGIVNGEIHISVRNVGYVRSAGEVVRAAFGDLGSAGGHRAMAKAVIRLHEWAEQVGEASGDAIRKGIVERFLRVLGENGRE